jgi:phosphate transport system substrate-binding protein
MSLRLRVRAARLAIYLGVIFFLQFNSQVQAEEIVRVGGSGTGLGAMTLLSAAFEKNHPGIKVQVLPNLGSIGGIMALSKGALDLALIAHPLSPEDRLGGLMATEYARTPFVFTAHKDVGKDNLTVRELENIYLGKTVNWPDGRRIRLVLRPESHKATLIVKSIAYGVEQAMAVARSRNAYLLAVTDQDCSETVAQVAGALGTSTLTQVVTEKKSLKMLNFEGVAPSTKALSNGSYPLSISLYLVTAPRQRPAVQQFAKFVLSAAGRNILAKSGNLVLDPPDDK